MANTIYNPETARDNPGTLTRYRPGHELGLDGFWVSTPATAEVFFFGSLDKGGTIRHGKTHPKGGAR